MALKEPSTKRRLSDLFLEKPDPSQCTILQHRHASFMQRPISIIFILLTIFVTLPYVTVPDYYEIIEKPIAINDILRKCRAKLYSNLQEFNADWQLMFANARKFNGDDSWVVEDAQALEKELERVLKKNGFSDEHVPTSKKKKKLRIKLSLKSNNG